MSKFITNLSNFKSGMLTKKLQGRVDIAEHASGLSIGKNALISKQGGAYKAKGWQTLMQLSSDNASGSQFLSVVLFSRKTINMVFDGSFVRFYNHRGLEIAIAKVTTGTVGLFNVAVYESTIVIVNYDGNQQPLHIEFELNSVDQIRLKSLASNVGEFLFQVPQTSPNTEDLKLRVSAITTTAGATRMDTDGTWDIDDYFEVNDIVMLTAEAVVGNGTKIDTGAYAIVSFASATSANVVSLVAYPLADHSVSPPTQTDLLDPLAPTTYSASRTVQFPYPAPNNFSLYSIRWSRSVWSDTRGWPRTVAVDEGRLIYGGTRDFPNTIWASNTNNPLFMLDRRFDSSPALVSYFDGTSTFQVELGIGHQYGGNIKETDPYNFTMLAKKGSEITFMESATNFIVGTSLQEFIVSGDGAAISQRNISVRAHTSHGSSPLKSIVFDNTVLFVGKNQKRIFYFKYSQENGSFISKELTILNPDLFEDELIKELAWSEEQNVCFILLESGSLVPLSINIEAGVAAFTEFDMGGAIQNIGYNDSTDGGFLIAFTLRNGVPALERQHDAITLVSELDLPNGISEFSHKFDYLDGGTVKTASKNTEDALLDYTDNALRLMDHFSDYIHFNKYDVKIGDTIEFDSNDVTIFSGLGIALNTTYYVIPFEDAGNGLIGIRLALTLVDAQNNTYINLTGSGIQLFDQGKVLYYKLDSVNEVINLQYFPSGTVLNVIAYKLNPLGVSWVEFEIISDGTSAFTLPDAYTFVVYGVPVDFHIATMPIEAGQQWGSAQLGIKRVDRVGVRSYNTVSYAIGTDGYNEEEVTYGVRTTTETDAEFKERTTGRREIELTGSPEFDQIIHIRNNKPEGCYISSIALRGVSNDG